MRLAILFYPPHHHALGPIFWLELQQGPRLGNHCGIHGPVGGIHGGLRTLVLIIKSDRVWSNVGDSNLFSFIIHVHLAHSQIRFVEKGTQESADRIELHGGVIEFRALSPQLPGVEQTYR